MLGERDFRVWPLPRARPAAQLLRQLDDLREPGRADRMTARKQSAVRPKATAARAIAGAAPAMRVDEFLDDSDFLADVLSSARDANGRFWPVLKLPYRLTKTPARARALPGAPQRVRRAPPAPARAPAPEDLPA
ncbi:hypothetical protein BG60_18535 [Caballeronia zhejiangensis]|uniref:Uncharacterized protein n=1 Tax=Caballeronia zhejiangensis TaxID=871203 RepID=A0A656QHG2_9BURK|nr:hypothetical protein BG60_18535 [Caballeronia zhejiangensis]